MAKRRELQELEGAFRRRMDQKVAVETRYKEKALRNEQIMDDLKRQINESNRILEGSAGENDGLEGQIQGKERAVAKREQELRELKEVIGQRARRGEELKLVLEEQKWEN